MRGENRQLGLRERGGSEEWETERETVKRRRGERQERREGRRKETGQTGSRRQRQTWQSESEENTKSQKVGESFNDEERNKVQKQDRAAEIPNH